MVELQDARIDRRNRSLVIAERKFMKLNCRTIGMGVDAGFQFDYVRRIDPVDTLRAAAGLDPDMLLVIRFRAILKSLDHQPRLSVQLARRAEYALVDSDCPDTLRRSSKNLMNRNTVGWKQELIYIEETHKIESIAVPQKRVVVCRQLRRHIGLSWPIVERQADCLRALQNYGRLIDTFVVVNDEILKPENSMVGQPFLDVERLIFANCNYCCSHTPP